MNELDEEETHITIPKSNKERAPEQYRFTERGSLSWDEKRKEKYIVKLLESGKKTPFNKRKYNAPNREIMYWALALGLSEDIPYHSKSTSSTVPHNVFENSKYTFILSRVAAILKSDSVLSLFDQNKVRTAVEDFANGGIIKLYEYCLGKYSGKDVEEGLMDLIKEALPEALEILEKLNPPDQTKED